MTFEKNKLTEKIIIDNFLNKLNFNKVGTYNFKNDAAYIHLNKKKKLVITTDSISENIDFFKNDDPKSIATKLTTSNLSDLSAMGSNPYAYTLNLFLPKYVNKLWLKKFTQELYKIQKKYNFYLLGGDLSRADKLILNATFFGYSKFNKIINQKNLLNSGNDIWITGNIGDSYIGLQLLKNKIKIKNKNLYKYFINKYYYPEPCLIGSKISNYVQSMKDISDGLFADLKKITNDKYGVIINLNKIPISSNLSKFININNYNKINYLKYGDDYQLVVVSKQKFRNKIINIAKMNNTKITLIGKITKKIGIFNDSDKLINISGEYDHFL